MDAPVRNPSETRRPRLRIGAWLVDADANALERDGMTTRIEPKAMRVLRTLADRAGQVVSRDDLLSTVWAGTVVGDEALTQTIIKLRKALGDNPRSSAYIETIPKGGYRLVASVREERAADVQAGAAAPSASAGHVPANPRAPPMRTMLAAMLVLVTLAGGGAYWMHAQEVRTPDADALAESDAPITVTVLPFESLSRSVDQAYLAQGIGHDLMTDLSRLPGLRVISPPAGSPGAAASTRARYVVSGSIQRDASTLRVNIRLVDSDTGRQLWSDRMERRFDDLFAVQDEIVRRVVELLPGRLTEAAREQRARRYTRSLEAYDLFLRAQALFLVRRAGVNDEARALYRKALALDPKFARAYAGLAMAYAMEYRLQPWDDASAALRRAQELAESARLIDPDIPEVYWALAFVHVQSRRFEAAIESLDKAIALNPSYADAYAFKGGVHTYVGQSDRTIPLVRTALRFNPDGGYLYYMILGRAYLYSNDTDQAIINLREAALRNPDDLETRLHLAAALAASGNRRAAEWEAIEVRAMAPGFSTGDWLKTYPLSHGPYRERLAALLGEAGL
jgi:TolB-like protein/DNA-binding winged helix-turn-helix (wHTH) protein/Flp pilus assembly protein TadD